MRAYILGNLLWVVDHWFDNCRARAVLTVGAQGSQGGAQLATSVCLVPDSAPRFISGSRAELGQTGSRPSESVPAL